MKKITNSGEFNKLVRRIIKRRKMARQDKWDYLLELLVFVCRLLDKDEDKRKKIKRAPSAYNKFVGKQLRAGKSIKEAAEIWNSRKGK